MPSSISPTLIRSPSPRAATASSPFGRAGTGHGVFGVFDGTSASGTVDGSFNAFISTLTLGGEQSGTATAGGGFGMLSIDNGTLDATSIVMARTTSAPTTGSPTMGV